MTYFKKILILFFSVQSTGSTISTTYNIELIIFEHKEVRTNEVFETNLNIEEDEVLNFRTIDLFYNKSSFNIVKNESFFSKLFADLKINRGNLEKEPLLKKAFNPKEWFRKKSRLNTLKKYEANIIKSKKYKHLESISWKQNIPSKNDSRFLEYENEYQDYGFLIKLYKERFLHVDLKAYLGSLSNQVTLESDYTKLYIDSFKPMLDLDNKNISHDIKLKLNKKNNYEKLNIDVNSQSLQNKERDAEIKIYINENRRIFDNDVHYFDHPRFGVILHISEDN
ncbi:MAG: CsiV family protein [SAR86 cluster bacterium]|nr:CsiV family protein [SAR86 cluster bacterium]